MAGKPWQILEQFDPEVFALIEAEERRQAEGIELIASENFASEAVLSAAANVFTNKYAEGLPGRRYYGGCEVVDQLETLAVERACGLFGCSYANVQPHSGAQANAAVFHALLNPGDRVLALDLTHGGHLSHGSAVNFTGQVFDCHFYGVDPCSEQIDMEAVRRRAREVVPKLLVAGASAYPRHLDFAAFRSIADEVGAYLLVDMAHVAGLVAARLHPDPVPHAHVITTTTHKTLRGPRGGVILWQDAALSKQLNKGVFPGTQGGPCEHIIAAKAVCFSEASRLEFRSYQETVLANTAALGAELGAAGLRLVSGGSDNHMLLVDLSGTDCSGKEYEEALGRAAITVNKNTVPRERRSPFVTSGVRLGLPAMTTRGMRPGDMSRLARLLVDVLSRRSDVAYLTRLRGEVREWMGDFPLYAWCGEVSAHAGERR